ncbi:MAG: hypothetical protein Q8P67_04350 [archaeon]|nr:hypothetical protein [archaeon]
MDTIPTLRLPSNVGCLLQPSALAATTWGTPLQPWGGRPWWLVMLLWQPLFSLPFLGNLHKACSIFPPPPPIFLSTHHIFIFV